jgi:RNA polymerase sigma factor (sigma-70 family)
LCDNGNKYPQTGDSPKVISESQEYRFRKIYSDHYAYLMNVIAHRVRNEHDAEEICQNLFVALYRKIDEVEDPGKWLRASVGYEILSYLRNKKRHDGVPLDDVGEKEDPSGEKAQDEMSIIIRDAIADRNNFGSDQEMVLFNLIAVNKYTYADAARELGVSRRQAEYGYGKASQHLMEYLRSKGIGAEDMG